MDDAARPTGTVSFLFTDVEGSTSLWERHRGAMAAALDRHDDLLRAVFRQAGGHVFSTAGDSFAVAFASAATALQAAVSAQRALRAERWPTGIDVRVRMGLHTGTAHERNGDYFGPTLNRAARLMGLAHGGQLLLSGAARELVGDHLGPDITLVDHGRHVLRGIERPEHVFEAVFDGGRFEFPPLRDGVERVGHLPLPATSFVGRIELVKQVGAALAADRVVTLVGPGGVGKTRLAIEVAADVADRFTDGVWLAELAPVVDPARWFTPSGRCSAFGPRKAWIRSSRC